MNKKYLVANTITFQNMNTTVIIHSGIDFKNQGLIKTLCQKFSNLRLRYMCYLKMVQKYLIIKYGVG